ncbi:MAG: hypothetical protein NVS1B13_25390 [Flavisolibacter sp.]
MITKKYIYSIVLWLGLLMSLTTSGLNAQCSICTRTAQQLGERPAHGLNAGILYLAFTPLAIFGFVAWKWWKKNKYSS